MLEEILKRLLDKLPGADFWIALGFLLAGFICWLLIGTKKQEKKVRRKQVGIALFLGLVGGVAIWMNHYFFLREPVFPKNVIGILVMRVVGDDALDSLQAALVENFNREVQEEAAEQPIEVHASREGLNDNDGLAAAHQRARIIGHRLNAKLVIWGRKIGAKEFYPYITMTTAPKNWSVKSERGAVVVQNIAELHLPKEFVDEPFYLMRFAAGYSYYAQTKYKEALIHFKDALRRKGGSANELADLQFLTAFCDHSLASGQKNMSANLQEAIGLYEKAAKVYAGQEQQSEKKWASTQSNLGNAYVDLPTGDRAANLQKAIAAFEAALRVSTEKDFPAVWAGIQNNLGNAYVELPTGDRAANLQKAIAAFEAAQRVSTEKDFPARWATAQNNLGTAYSQLPTGNRAANLQKGIAAFEAALRVSTEKDFPADWAEIQCNLGTAYGQLPTGDGAANLRKAKVCFEAALRVYTESGFPAYHRNIAAKLADVERQLQNVPSE
jgi:tetratricopeptide (TPR) repeat protein